jgi:hypothetical protein
VKIVTAFEWLVLILMVLCAAFRQYKLPMGNIIPFPKSNDPSSAQDFPPGKYVLAVYPGTTALYKATIVHGPRRVITLFSFIGCDHFLIFPCFHEFVIY